MSRPKKSKPKHPPSLVITKFLQTPHPPSWLLVLALALVLLVPFRGLFSRQLLCFRDFYSIYAPPRLYLTHAIRSGTLPFWDPYSGCGRDLLTDVRSVIWYPPQLLLLPLLSHYALTLLPFLHLLIAGSAMLLIVRQLSFPPSTALLAGISLMLAHSMLAPIEFMWDAVLCWTPVNLLLLLHFARRPRLLWLATIAFITAMQLTTHEVRAVTYSWLLLGFVWLALLVNAWASPSHPTSHRLQLACALPLSALLTFLLALFWFLPMWAGNRLSQFRQDVDFNYFANGSIPLSGLLAYLVPWWNGQPARGMWWNLRMYSEYWPQALFCGSWVWLFAPLTLPLCFRRTTPHRTLLIALWSFFLLALLIALGKYGPLLRPLYVLLPMLRGARWPGVAMQAANVALILLAAAGASAALHWLQRRARAPILLAAAWALTLIALLVFVYNRSASPTFLHATFGLDHDLPYPQLRPLVALLRSHVLVSLLFLSLIPAALSFSWLFRSNLVTLGAPWIVVLLTAAELLWHARPLVTMLDARAYSTIPEPVKLLHNHHNYPLTRIINGNNIPILNLALYGEHDWRKFLWYRSTAVAANHPMALRVPTAVPPDPPPLGQPWYDRFCRLFTPLQQNPSLLAFLSVSQLWSVRQYAVPPYDPADPLRNLAISPLTNWLPRITFPHTIIPAPSDCHAIAALTNLSFSLGRDAVIHCSSTTNTVSSAAPGNILSFREEFNTLLATVSVTRTGLAVFNSSYHPDWRCYIDGQPVPALRVNYAFRGCIVPTGTHEIRFVYTPRLMYIGAAISCFTFLTLLALCVAEYFLLSRSLTPPAAQPKKSYHS
ncbi:MAG: YfhO family protein [bacterium]|nr:YfhO family protein [bacterium]